MNLTKPESEKLHECEAVIEAGLDSFVEVGNALLAIRDQKLYRKSHKTFESYVKERWSMSQRHAKRLIHSATVVENLKSGPVGPLPSSESVVRPLTKVEPEKRVEVLERAADQYAQMMSATPPRNASITSAVPSPLANSVLPQC